MMEVMEEREVYRLEEHFGDYKLLVVVLVLTLP